jgi:glycosyltransferase involved in cell wall biosynthesis
MPDVSIIVPTHDRASMLREHLRALADQTYPRRFTEWIVVCDGCSDDSAQVARAAGADQVLELDGKGAGAARNAGLAAATSPLVLFLDDDIIPSRCWVQALVDDFQPGEARVLHMGYCPFAPSAAQTHLDRRNAAWYEAKLTPLRDPGHDWQFTDFFGGNFAAGRDDLRALGGFDTRFLLFEDAELGLRALNADWTIRFVPSARADHHAHRGLPEYGRQAFRSGQIDVLFAQVHPKARESLRLGIPRRPLKRALGSAWRAMAIHSALSLRVVERAAQIAEWLRLRPVLDLFYSLIWDGEYWRGVAAA